MSLLLVIPYYCASRTTTTAAAATRAKQQYYAVLGEFRRQQLHLHQSTGLRYYSGRLHHATTSSNPSRNLLLLQLQRQHRQSRHKLPSSAHFATAAGSSSFAAALSFATARMMAPPTRCEHAIVSYPTRNYRKEEEERLRSARRSWREIGRTLRRAWRMLIRFVKLSFTLAPVTLFYPVLLLTGSTPLGDGSDAHQVVLAQNDDERVGGLLGWYLRTCLTCVEYSGAAVIKLMQWAGSRPDLFGRDFCSVFSQLQDHTTPHRWAHTNRVMKDAFGENWRDIIDLQEIVGSGCIGQVYSGEVVVKDDLDKPGNDSTRRKQKVAVKVLHPSVEDDIDADLDLMRFAVRAVKYLPFDVFANLKWLNMEGIVEEFASLLKLQLGKYLWAFRGLYFRPPCDFTNKYSTVCVAVAMPRHEKRSGKLGALQRKFQRR